MKLEGDSIYRWVERVAGGAEKFVIVSPFFSTSAETRRLLESVQNLQILVGDEFSTNNPKHLMELSERESADIRYVCRYMGGLENRLHAKVFYGVEASGRRRALVGSANFTVSGLRKNKEQAVSFDSDRESDRAILDRIERWIEELDNRAKKIDWEWAKREYERSAVPHFPTDDFEGYRQGQAKSYWVLKTTEGSYGKTRWQDFVRERVVSIGWVDIVEIVSDEDGIQPTEYTLETLRAAADKWAKGLTYRVRAGHAARMLHKFSREFSIGDRIILCKGYSAKQTADVRLYGRAVVDGEVVYHAASDWWRLKRRAVFRCEDRRIPKDVFVSALGKGSLRYTIHRIEKEEYEEFCRQIQRV